MIFKEEWTLNQQEILSEFSEINTPKKLGDYRNISLALQIKSNEVPIIKNESSKPEDIEK